MRDHGAIRFTHPLLSSVLYGDLGDERHEVHERIAAIVADPLVRAQHLALAQDGPDAAVASELDAAAKVATGRGAHAMAAELAEHALRLTPPSCPDDAHRRALATARLHLADGEWPRARTIAADLLADAGEGGPRAEALLVLSEIEVDDQSVSLLEEALRDAAGRPALESLIYSRLAWARRFRDGFDGAVDDARRAVARARRLDDDALEVASLSILVTLETLVGEPGAPANAERAYLVATRSGDPELMREAIELLAILDTNAGRLRDARERFEQLYADWRERDEGWSAGLLWSLAWIELWSGRWELAAQRAADARDISIQYGREKSQDYIPSSWIAAPPRAGRAARCRGVARARARPMSRSGSALLFCMRSRVSRPFGAETQRRPQTCSGRRTGRRRYARLARTRAATVDCRLRRGAARARPYRRASASW